MFLKAIVGLIVLFILNAIIGSVFRKNYIGNEAFYKRIVSTGTNVGYCLIGIGMIALAYYYVPFLKWPVIIIWGAIAAFEIISFVIAVIGQIVGTISYSKASAESRSKCLRGELDAYSELAEDDNPYLWLVVLSKLIDSCTTFIVVLLCLHACFNLF